MSEILKGLLGRKVSVWTLEASTTRDDGVLHAFDDKVVVLDKGKELLYIPWTAIRLIKLSEGR
jgi:hypothetical protein